MIATMKRYGNRSQRAGVIAYEYGATWIRLQFAGGEIYEYPARKVGSANLKKMKRYADEGEGLTTFINKNPEVKNGYVRDSERSRRSKT
jgi:hypothetical protein